jgi:hypothetical protein
VRQTWLRVPPGEVVPIGTPLAAESAGGRVHDGGPGPQPVSGPVPSECQPFPELNCYGGDRPIRPPIRPRVSATVGSVGGPSGSRPCRHHHPAQRPRTTTVTASELPSASVLLITNLVQDPVEIAANYGDIGVVVAKSGLGDLDGPLRLSAGAVQVAPGGQDAGEVAELAANPAARLLARAVPTVRGCVPAMPARVSGSPVVAVAGVVPPPPHHQVQHEQ